MGKAEKFVGEVSSALDFPIEKKVVIHFNDSSVEKPEFIKCRTSSQHSIYHRILR